jgi:adenosine/AMP kinase
MHPAGKPAGYVNKVRRMTAATGAAAQGATEMTGTAISIEAVPVDKPGDVNVIVGQAHFIKTVEDLHEALIGVSPHLRFGLAFCEASGDRLVRRAGNDEELTALAVAGAQAISAGHAFVIMLRDGFPVNVLNPVKGVPEVCTIFCATANPVSVLVATAGDGRGVIGAIDGAPPVGVETDADAARRHRLLRDIGYKL